MTWFLEGKCAPKEACDSLFKALHAKNLLHAKKPLHSGESEKTWGIYCTVAWHGATPSLWSKFFNAANDPSPLKKGHLMHLLKNIFLMRPCMGVL